MVIVEGGGWVGVSDFFCWLYGLVLVVGLFFLLVVFWLF